MEMKKKEKWTSVSTKSKINLLCAALLSRDWHRTQKNPFHSTFIIENSSHLKALNVTNAVSETEKMHQQQDYCSCFPELLIICSN